MVIAEVIGLLFYVFAPLLISAFTREPEAVTFGVQKARVCSLFYFLLAATHGFASILRGAGKSIVPMLSMLLCWCIIRVSFLWIMVPLTESIDAVNWVYPLTWTLSTIVLYVYYLFADWTNSSILKNK